MEDETPAKDAEKESDRLTPPIVERKLLKFRRAVRFLTKSMEKRNPEATLALGDMYANVESGDIDPEKALSLYESAMKEFNSNLSLKRVGISETTGAGKKASTQPQPDLQAWYRSMEKRLIPLAEAGHPQAWVLLSRAYYHLRDFRQAYRCAAMLPDDPDQEPSRRRCLAELLNDSAFACLDDDPKEAQEKDEKPPPGEPYPDPGVPRREGTLSDKGIRVLLYGACCLVLLGSLAFGVDSGAPIPLWIKLLWFVFLGPGIFLFVYYEIRSARAKGEALFRRGRHRRAIEQFSIGCDEIDPVAAMRLGDMHRDGLGTEANPAKAMAAYFRSVLMVTHFAIQPKDGDRWRANMERSLAIMGEAGREDAYILLCHLHDDDTEGKALECAGKAFRLSPTADNEANLALRLISRKNASRREADEGYGMLSRLAGNGHGDSLYKLVNIRINGIPGLFEADEAEARLLFAKALAMSISDPEAMQGLRRQTKLLMSEGLRKFGPGFADEEDVIKVMGM